MNKEHKDPSNIDLEAPRLAWYKKKMRKYIKTQCIGSVNSTPDTSHFLVFSHLVTRTCVAQAQVWRAQRTFHIISCVIFMRSCCVFDSPRLLPFSSSCCLSSLLSSCFSSWPSISSSTMWWTNSQCTSACRVRPSHRVDIKLAQQKGLKFYQTRSNAIILYDTPSLLYPESCCDGIWRNHLRESI